MTAATACGSGQDPASGPAVPCRAPAVTITRYVCPWCRGRGRCCDGRCLECHGSGLVDSDAPGVDLTCDGSAVEVAAVPLGPPPGVMRQPCGDCAYRPGSPEDDAGTRHGPQDGPFYCHYGMHKTATGYEPVAWYEGRPVGYLVCAGWWAAATGQPLPERPYREPRHPEHS